VAARHRRRDGGAADSPSAYRRRGARVDARRRLRRDEHERNVALTDAGFRHAESLLRCGPLHAPEQQLTLAAIHVALHAEVLLSATATISSAAAASNSSTSSPGRVAVNRRWPHGIQPAVEAKEGVEVRPEGVVLGSIPIQHFVRLWPPARRMTATPCPPPRSSANSTG